MGGADPSEYIFVHNILHLIQDMEDPFEYDETHEVKSDEVSLEVLNHLQDEFERKKIG